MKKRIFLCLAAFFIGFVASAQSFELGLSAGTSAYCRIDAGADFALVFPTSTGFDFGGGAGLRFANPLNSINTSLNTVEANLTKKRDYDSHDLTIPVFARIRYNSPFNLFLQVDGGYRLGLVNIAPEEVYYNSDTLLGGSAHMEKATFHGFYIEPQGGYRFNGGNILSIGLTLQQHTWQSLNTIITDTGNSTSTKTSHGLVPIVFIKYGFVL